MTFGYLCGTDPYRTELLDRKSKSTCPPAPSNTSAKSHYQSRIYSAVVYLTFVPTFFILRSNSRANYFVSVPVFPTSFSMRVIQDGMNIHCLRMRSLGNVGGVTYCPTFASYTELVSLPYTTAQK